MTTAAAGGRTRSAEEVEADRAEQAELAALCGRRLKAARRSCGWTQYQLAEKSGIFQGHISHFECGIRVPLVRNLLKLSDALDVSCDFLLGRDGADPPPEPPRPPRKPSARREPTVPASYRSTPADAAPPARTVIDPRTGRVRPKD